MQPWRERRQEKTLGFTAVCEGGKVMELNGENVLVLVIESNVPFSETLFAMEQPWLVLKRSLNS